MIKEEKGRTPRVNEKDEGKERAKRSEQGGHWDIVCVSAEAPWRRNDRGS